MVERLPQESSFFLSVEKLVVLKIFSWKRFRMVIIYQLNIKYVYVSQACMLILHRIENNKSG